VKFTDDLIPMWVADMDFDIAPEIREELINHAKRGAFGYPSSNYEPLYRSIINYYKENYNFDIK
jgi:cystathionine beta-lyase